MKRTLAEKEWENETMSREMTSNNAIIDKLRNEKGLLEETVASLKEELAESRNAYSLATADERSEDNELILAKQEAGEWEARCKSVLKEKETTEDEIGEMQHRMADMEADNEKLQRELHFSNKANSMKVRVFPVLRCR